jgi:hypothetical protein
MQNQNGSFCVKLSDWTWYLWSGQPTKAITENNIPVPSPGVGGACLSKDPYILASVCKKSGCLIHLSFLLEGE